MLVHRDLASGQRAAPGDWLDLQGQVLKADGVVLVDRALEPQRKDQVQVRDQRHPGSRRDELPEAAQSFLAHFSVLLDPRLERDAHLQSV